MPFELDRPVRGPLEPPIAPIKATPVSERGVWRSAFDTENDLVALNKIFELQSIPFDPDFNLAEYSKDDPLFQVDPEQFLSATSAEQYDVIRAQFASSLLSRETLEKGGANSIVATIAASMASPTLLIPGGQIARGISVGRAALRLAGTAGAGGATAVTAQELALQAAPNDRSPEESLINIGLGTLLTAGLGGGIGAIAAPRPIAPLGESVGAARARKPDAVHVYVPDEAPSAVPAARAADEVEARIEELTEKAEVTPVEAEELIELEETLPINPTQTHEALIGSQGDVRLDSALGLENTVGRMSPTVRGYVNKYSNTVRDMMRRLDSGGLLFKDEGGKLVANADVATRAKNWEGVYYKAKLRSQGLIKDYHQTSLRTEDRLSASEIMEQAADAIDGGLDAYTGPDIVKAVARSYQEEVFKPFAEEAKRLGFSGNEHWMDPGEYVPHMIRRSMVAGDHEDFVQVLTEHFAEKIHARVTEDLTRLHTQAARREEEAKDITLSPEETVELRERLKTFEQEIDDGLKPPSKRKLERAAAMREEAKGLEGDAAKALRAQATELEKSNKELQERHARLRGIKRRQRNLGKGILAVREQIQKKNTQIREAENQNLRTLNSLTVKAHGFIQRLEEVKGKRVTVKELNEFNDEVNALMKTVDDFVAKNPDYAALARDATTREGKAKSAALISSLRDVADVQTYDTVANVKRRRATIRGQITRGEKAGRDVQSLEIEEMLLTDEYDTLVDDLPCCAKT